MKLILNIRALIGYGRAWREFAARVRQHRIETEANFDAAMGRLQESPCPERLDEVAQAFSERLGFEEHVRRVVRLDPLRFAVESRAVDGWPDRPLESPHRPRGLMPCGCK